MTLTSKSWMLWHLAALVIWIAEVATFVQVMPHLNERGLSAFFHLLGLFFAALAGWFISALGTAFTARDDPWAKAYKIALPLVLAVPAVAFTHNVFSALY